jgi:hypothetical protein
MRNPRFLSTSRRLTAGNAELYCGTDIWSTNVGVRKKDVLTGGETSTVCLERLGLLVGAGRLMVANRLLSGKALHSILRPGALRSAPSTESDKHD